MRVLLIFPPYCDVAYPYSALPYLTSVLREAGHEVVQRDLNVELFHAFLSTQWLSDGFEVARRRFEQLDRQNSLSFKEQQEYLRFTPFAGLDIPPRPVLPDRASLENSEDFQLLMFRLSRLVDLSLASYPQLRLNGIFKVKGSASPTSTRVVLQEIVSNSFRPLDRFFQEKFQREILCLDPNLVGISITYLDQIIPGLRLARLVKEVCPWAHVTIGGNIFTRLADRLTSLHSFFRFVNSFVIYEGESALVALADTLDTSGDLATVPNLIYSDRSGVQVNQPFHFEHVNDLPTPDYEGLSLGSYLCPVRTLPLLTTRGCPWAKCAFCDHGYIYDRRYREREIDLVISDIKTLVRRFGTEVIELSDEMVATGRLEQIAEGICSAGISLSWFADARLEGKFSEGLCRKLARSGCKALAFGMESASQRVLDLMNKGYCFEDVTTILKNLREAGIMAIIMAFLGFPGESEKEAEQTLDFVRQNLNFMALVGVGSFALGLHSPVFRDAKRYAVQILPEEEQDLSIVREYQSTTGISPAQARSMSEDFCQELLSRCWDFNCHSRVYSVASVHLFRLPQTGCLRTPEVAETDFEERVVCLVPNLEKQVFSFDVGKVSENLNGPQSKDEILLSPGVLLRRGTREASVFISSSLTPCLELINGCRTVHHVCKEASLSQSAKAPTPILASILQERFYELDLKLLNTLVRRGLAC